MPGDGIIKDMEHVDPTKLDLQLLGKIIGTSNGWDEFGDRGMLFYNFIPNQLGLKFIRQEQWSFKEPKSLAIDGSIGEIELYDDFEGGNPEPIKVNPDWSVFNNEEAISRSIDFES